jgi:hypothetical protein
VQLPLQVDIEAVIQYSLQDVTELVTEGRDPGPLILHGLPGGAVCDQLKVAERNKAKIAMKALAGK